MTETLVILHCAVVIVCQVNGRLKASSFSIPRACNSLPIRLLLGLFSNRMEYQTSRTQRADYGTSLFYCTLFSKSWDLLEDILSVNIWQSYTSFCNAVPGNILGKVYSSPLQEVQLAFPRIGTLRMKFQWHFHRYCTSIERSY